ncbi:MAG: electron transfer flavoprotein subunit alpha/FixB family protein [Conexivisphaerales archaeon]
MSISGQCPDWIPVNPNEHKNVWVYIEIEKGHMHEASIQLLGKAKEVAGKVNSKLVAIMIGNNLGSLLNEPGMYGADEVIYVEGQEFETYYAIIYGEVMVQLAMKYKPEAFLIAGTMRGRELAPYIANHLRTGITADLTMIEVDEKTKEIILIRPPFGAWQLAHIRTLRRRPVMGSVRPNVFPLPAKDENSKAKITQEKAGELYEPGLELLEREEIKESEEKPIEKAEVIVSGGKGLGSKEGFEIIKELAEQLHGTYAGSRKAVDMGWIQHDRQVGQTGKTVRPNLYVAVAISGAAQHVFGIREAKRIIAINSDPNAPIFDNADYGVVGDYRQIIPELIKLIDEAKNAKK